MLHTENPPCCLKPELGGVCVVMAANGGVKQHVN